RSLRCGEAAVEMQVSDAGNRSDRLFEGVTKVMGKLRRDRLAGNAAGLTGEELEHGARALDSAARFGEGLTLLARERFSELLTPFFHAALNLEQDLPAHGRGRLPPALERARSRVTCLGGLRRRR